MAKLSFWKEFARYLAMLGLATAILWQVAESTGQRDAQAIVHVPGSMLGASVILDAEERRVEDRMELPMVFKVLPGNYRVALYRDGVMLDQQSFEAEAGRETVLSLWESPSAVEMEPVSLPTRDACGRHPRHVLAKSVLAQ